MSETFNFFDSRQAAQELGTNRDTLLRWLSNNPEYRPKRRFSGDDLLWTDEDIQRVREARERSKKRSGQKVK